ncbi:hypothetical protein PHISP_07298 [Aspergillus sp. HF37]|nr:hypothetical protein PHISP_07298 [Aspergillus sp. HF37]
MKYSKPGLKEDVRERSNAVRERIKSVGVGHDGPRRRFNSPWNWICKAQSPPTRTCLTENAAHLATMDFPCKRLCHWSHLKRSEKSHRGSGPDQMGSNILCAASRHRDAKGDGVF